MLYQILKQSKQNWIKNYQKINKQMHLFKKEKNWNKLIKSFIIQCYAFVLYYYGISKIISFCYIESIKIYCAIIIKI